ncbi:MAG: response regulator [Chloroflexota bacterium]
MTKANVLIIDANINDILVLDHLLQLEGIHSQYMESTRDLGEALNTVKTVDLIFLSLEMPGINGYQALPILRQHPNTVSARMIAYSVYIDEVATAISRGFDGFIGKPLDANTFSEQFQKILRGETVRYIPY